METTGELSSLFRNVKSSFTALWKSGLQVENLALRAGWKLNLLKDIEGAKGNRAPLLANRLHRYFVSTLECPLVSYLTFSGRESLCAEVTVSGNQAAGLLPLR